MEEKLVSKAFKDSVRVKEMFFSKKNISLVVEASTWIAESFKSGGKLMVMGNGGSAADSQHIAAEFINRFEIERPPLPAIALTTDSSILTSIGNDYDFKFVFSKQVKALGKEADVLLAISTSGASQNVVKAVETAKGLGIKTIALTGKEGGELIEKADLVLNVESQSTPRIQEAHITICHIICELVDHILFKKVSA
ncbi:MAG TPA: D-sedoheptulose 7-phosphate isomerase [Thermodesulfobacteriota bacterium]|nr:D-sedoheptulose 7-phosphate isomerase [Thermodesulfobacteriota bacterium]